MLLTKSNLVARAQKASGYYSEGAVRDAAIQDLILEKKAADSSGRSFDVFLSHSSEDAILIRGLRDELTHGGLTVYVDWIDDPQLDRSNVSAATAATLRRRMESCRCLLYATSTNARGSLWMPWELGFMDAKTESRVAIVPIVENDTAATQAFVGVEYLGLYPYLDKAIGSFWIQRSVDSFVSFSSWLQGANP